MASATETREMPNIGASGGSMGYNQAVLSSMGHTQFAYPMSNVSQSCQTKDDLAHAFGHMNVNLAGTIGANASNGILPFPLTAIPGSVGSFYQLPDGRIIPSRLSSSNLQQNTEHGNSSASSQYMAYMNGLQANQGIAGAAHAIPWNGGQQLPRGGKSVPDLAAPRRNSISSNEENGPRTPFYHTYNQGGAQTKIVYGDSPQAWHTPSPPQMNGSASPYQIAKSPNGQYFFTDLTAVCTQEPSIPRPIPAIFSGERGRGTLERSLQNNLNTTNVYIRGLHPNTTDEMLHGYGARFGKIISAKSMLEQDTGNCKGFGFIKYHNFSDGENCIRAFFHWGYEAKWARVSHNEKLKTLGDDNNTNLYVSNLPMDFNEHSLMACFEDFEVLSAKILRDANGMSRGVGFARFASPDICRKVIDQYNGMKIGDDGNLLSIRFADTPEQKKLKQVTAERRQYKATEYNTAAYSPGSPYASAALPATYNSPLQARAPATAWNPQTQLPALISPYPFSPYPPSPIPVNVSVHKPSILKESEANGHVQISNSALRTEICQKVEPTVKMEPLSNDGLGVRSGNIQSPAKSEGNLKSDYCCSDMKQGDVKSSPIKSSKFSPLKGSPTKVNLFRD